MKRYSKKRQSIIECLKSTKTHPSAEWIYEKLKPIYPDLSLGTVYRNLNELKESGEIKSLGKVAGKERFDATTIPHSHLVCKKCGKVIDIDGEFINEEVSRSLQKKTGFTVSGVDLTFSGLCVDCKNSEGK